MCLWLNHELDQQYIHQLYHYQLGDSTAYAEPTKPQGFNLLNEHGTKSPTHRDIQSLLTLPPFSPGSRDRCCRIWHSTGGVKRVLSHPCCSARGEQLATVA